MFSRRVVGIFVAAVAILLATSCQAEPVVETIEVTSAARATETVTVETVVETVVVEDEVNTDIDIEATPPPAATKDLIVCQPQEPESLYFYGADAASARSVFHGIYENNITTLSYDHQAQGIRKVPRLIDGDASIRGVEVQTGDIVVDAHGDLVILEVGLRVIDAEGTEVVFDGSAVTMGQMVVNFEMKQRIWSDGTPVTAADSVYSFELNADPATPADKFVIARTADYSATDNLSTQWVGVPGYFDPTYFMNFWQPLPQHAWGNLTAGELLKAELSSRFPIGDGPFAIKEWVPGERIRLERNPYYYRLNEGFPYLDSVTYKFIPESNDLIGKLLSGECDIGTQDGIDTSLAPFLFEAADNGFLTPYFQTGTVYEHIDFGINSYGDYGDGVGRPDWFEDVRVRQAVTLCTDRQRMVDEILYGRSKIMHSYLPDIHPLYPPDIKEWPYDVDAANRLLDDVGFIDSDGDGIREDSATGVLFSVSLQAPSGSELSRQLTEIFRENMHNCGINVELDYRSGNELFANNATSLIFGRRFDLGQFAWPVNEIPRCELFSSWQITGPAEELNPVTGLPYGGWNGLNNTGWVNSEYDAACQAAKSALPGTQAYTTQHQNAQRIFAENLPILPLFLRIEVAVARPEVLNFDVNPTQSSELWNLFEINLQSTMSS